MKYPIVIYPCEESSAFANRDGRGEFGNCGANAKPLHP